MNVILHYTHNDRLRLELERSSSSSSFIFHLSSQRSKSKSYLRAASHFIFPSSWWNEIKHTTCKLMLKIWNDCLQIWFHHFHDVTFRLLLFRLVSSRIDIENIDSYWSIVSVRYLTFFIHKKLIPPAPCIVTHRQHFWYSTLFKTTQHNLTLNWYKTKPTLKHNCPQWTGMDTKKWEQHRKQYLEFDDKQ